MCGIFGLSITKQASKKIDPVKVLNDLFLLSETRGKEASGVVFLGKNEKGILKSPLPASELIKGDDYKSLIKKNVNSFKDHNIFTALGHSRLVTNGVQSMNKNNQPIITEDYITIHNGIITNHKEMFERIDQQPQTDLDTEIFNANLAKLTKAGSTFEEALAQTFKDIEGNASIAMVPPNYSEFVLATNNGSIYYANVEPGVFFFASEMFIVSQMLKSLKVTDGLEDKIIHLAPNEAIAINFITGEQRNWNMLDKSEKKTPSKTKIITMQNYSLKDAPDEANLKRCTKCILPETFPNITFNDEGICNNCLSHKKFVPLGPEKLKEDLAPYRRTDGKPDCLVGLSGGRDSCYGLHYVKKVLGLNPIAYTYDWGMVTDLARRNTARICGKLGVEHILISADIAQKRENVRKNIAAWLKKPELGMIPLFMAGDKQFYYYAHQLRKQTGIPLFMFCAGNVLERTDFKIAYAGLKGDSGKGILTDIGMSKKAKILGYYAKEFLTNPSYINSSLFDTFFAFYSSYLLKDDYLYLYHYTGWNEDEVVSTLINEYDWEISPDTTTTWRIGDGTAAFYNYIFYLITGFTEHDTFRSNQVREGMITREKALELVAEDNKPRWETLEWYAKTVGFNLDLALSKIHQMPRHYN